MDQGEFSEFVRNSGLEVRTLAREFNISIPCAKRWLTGVAMPSPKLIDFVIDRIAKVKDQEMAGEFDEDT
jgi:hypothetical protein